MRVQRFFSGLSSVGSSTSAEKSYSNKYHRGFMLKERQTFTPEEETKVNIYEEPSNSNVTSNGLMSLFSGSFKPTPMNSEPLIVASSPLDIILFSKWLSFLSGILVSSESLQHFSYSLQDGVILNKFMYNFFMATAAHSEDVLDPYTIEKCHDQAKFIKENLIISPRTEKEASFNFEIFAESCKVIGIDSFGVLKRSFLIDYCGEQDAIVERFFLLEETLYRMSNTNVEVDESDFEEDYYSDTEYLGRNLKKRFSEDEKRFDVQRKRLQAYYLMALKHNQRLVKERLDEQNQELFEDDFDTEVEEPYEKSKGFWNFFGGLIAPVSSKSGFELKGHQVTKDEEERIIEIKSTVSVKEARKRRKRRKQKKEEEESSTVYYLVESDSENDDENEQNGNDEEMSLASKLEILMNPHESFEEKPIDIAPSNESGVSTTSVYYVIDELKNLDTDLTKMADDVLNRFSKLKASDRATRFLETYSQGEEVMNSFLMESDNRSEIDKRATTKEINQISNLLSGVKVIQEKLKDSANMETPDA